ncbi:MAG: hypothetical protein EBT92_16220 [Planctomycetes bacterium]|nr:hypothetical protein [Planctomycetota bacterium]
MNNKVNPAFVPFTGTIDQLLANMDKVDVDQVERVVVDQTEDAILSNSDAIAMIMAEANVSHEEAVDILNDIKCEEVKRVLDGLMNEGLVEVTSYDEDGQPLYNLTENGKVLAKGFSDKKK